MDPRTQLPWWMITSHLWAVLSSRASGVRLQISTLSKCSLKSSNFILSKRHVKEQAVIHFSEGCPTRVLPSQSSRARSPACVDPNSSGLWSDCGDMQCTTGEKLALTHCAVKHKKPYCLSLILTYLTPIFIHHNCWFYSVRAEYKMKRIDTGTKPVLERVISPTPSWP